MIGYIYKTTNLINGKIYIGKHLATKFSLSYKGSGAILKQAFKKYGKENFSCDLLAEATTEEELNNLEAYWIETLDSRNPEIGYNIVEGGLGTSGYTHSEEAKQKMSEAKKGKSLTPEWKAKIAEAGTKRTNSEETRKKISESNKGRVFSEESRRKMSESHKRNPIIFTEDYRRKLRESRAEAMSSGRWSISEEGMERIREAARKPKSEEHRRKLSEARKAKQIGVGANSPRAKKIYCVETDTVYSWSGEVVETLGISLYLIRKCCTGKIETANGYHLRYLDSRENSKYD